MLKNIGRMLNFLDDRNENTMTVTAGSRIRVFNDDYIGL